MSEQKSEIFSACTQHFHLEENLYKFLCKTTDDRLDRSTSLNLLLTKNSYVSQQPTGQPG